jgi:hypothetical protein
MIFHFTPYMPAGTGTGELERDLMAATRFSLRRWRIIQTSLMLLLTSAVLVLLVVLRADRATIAGALGSLNPVVKALQTDVKSLSQLPSALPQDLGEKKPKGLTYLAAEESVREYAKAATGPVIIAWSGWLPLVWGDGYGVIVYDNDNHTVRSEWMTSKQFLKAREAQKARIKEWEQQQRSAVAPAPPS